MAKEKEYFDRTIHLKGRKVTCSRLCNSVPVENDLLFWLIISEYMLSLKTKVFQSSTELVSTFASI